MKSGVTRFAEIAHDFGNILKTFGNFLSACPVFGKIWKIPCAFGPFYIIVIGKVLSK